MIEQGVWARYPAGPAPKTCRPWIVVTGEGTFTVRVASGTDGPTQILATIETAGTHQAEVFMHTGESVFLRLEGDQVKVGVLWDRPTG